MMSTPRGNNQEYLRRIGDYGDPKGPTTVFVGGIHGNEPSGVTALRRVFAWLEAERPAMQGRVLGIAGNLGALQRQQRYIDVDLNRIWDAQFTQRYQARMANRSQLPPSNVAEHEEQFEIFSILAPLLAAKQQVYFLDLHTTSAESAPFIAINDQLNNRDFALQFPVPTVLGIEEYLHGPLLSYLNDFGPVALAFEAGSHAAPASIDLHEAFIYQALNIAGIIDARLHPDWPTMQARLNQPQWNRLGIFEVLHRHAILPADGFKMSPGFSNFVPVKKGDHLATDRHGPILAEQRARIFMPLYQTSGEDGFFLVRAVPKWALAVSRFLRNINFDRWLVWLPGVSRSPDQPDTLLVNRRIARLLANELFHLLGYRRKKIVGDQLVFSRREIR